jgi:hypothetical protein
MTCGWWVFLCSNFYAVKAKHGTLTALLLKTKLFQKWFRQKLIALSANTVLTKCVS